MKKTFTFLMAISIVLGLQAQVYLEETFNYSTTRLASLPGDPRTGENSTQFEGFDPVIGTWYQSSNTGQSLDGSVSHLIGEYPLYYEGYIASDKGKSVVIKDDVKNMQRVDVMRFSETIITTGEVYYAFLLNVTDFKTYSGGTASETNYEWRDVFVLCDGAGKNVGQRLRGRFFIRQEGNNTIEYTISKNANFEKMDGAQPEAKGSVSLGDTHLFIIKQTFTGDATCKLEVIANPIINETEPTTGWISHQNSDTYNGAFGVGIRHRWLATSAEATLGGLRVARTWGEVLGLTDGLSSISVDKDIYANGKTIVTGRPGTAKVFNITGQEIISTQINGQLATDLSTGIYIVRFTDEAGKITSSKVIIK